MRTLQGITLALSLSALGCSVYRSPPIGRTVEPGRVVRVSSTSPMMLGTFDDVRRGDSKCRVVWLEGELHQVAADTLVLRRVSYFLESDNNGVARRQNSCPRTEDAAMLVRTPDSKAWERYYSRGRTAVVIVGAAALIVAIASFLSPLNGDWYEFPSSG